MAGSVSERLAALQWAVDADQWDEFAEGVEAWAGEQPDNLWLQAGRVVAAAVRGEDTSQTRDVVRALDARLAAQIELLADVQAGDRQETRSKVMEELAYGSRDPVLLGALQWAEPGPADPIKNLFATAHLVGGCVLNNGQITSMAARGSRMSADSLGHRMDQIWSDVSRLNRRIDLGIVQSVVVLGEDGGWALASTGGDNPRMASVLVAAASVATEAAARAQVVIAAGEAEHD